VSEHHGRDDWLVPFVDLLDRSHLEQMAALAPLADLHAGVGDERKAFAAPGDGAGHVL
jgi:hypothetical protein